MSCDKTTPYIRSIIEIYLIELEYWVVKPTSTRRTQGECTQNYTTVNLYLIYYYYMQVIYVFIGVAN